MFKNLFNKFLLNKKILNKKILNKKLLNKKLLNYKYSTIKKQNKDNLILCLYGRAGYETLNYFMYNNFFDHKYINIFTHKKNNKELINFLEYNKLKYHTSSINKNLDLIKDKSGLLISMHYRYIINEEILNNFNGRKINLHPSLLPKYKGCFSIPWSIINNEKYTGITFHEITKNIDEGNIILQKKHKIQKNDTSYSLYHKLITLSIQNLDELMNLINNNYYGYQQKGNGKYYKRKLPYNGIINNSWNNEKKKNFVRAIYFPPFKNAILKTKIKDIEIDNINYFDN